MTVAIPLTGKRGAGLAALVDDEDAARVETRRWYLGTDGYPTSHVVGTGKYGRHESLHRWLVGARPGDEVDHENRDKLDNRRPNLRHCTRSQNRANSIGQPGRRQLSRFKGVTNLKGRWKAQTTVRGTHLNLGYFDTEEEAARAYDAAVREHFGPFARCNFST